MINQCVTVATSADGLSLFRSCLDLANESQKVKIVSEIIQSSLVLAPDSFGYSIVLYILDLSEGIFADAVTKRFIGNVYTLSVQEFSSIVVEKVHTNCGDIF